MGIEIERRFLVENEDWKDQVIRRESFSQAYLNSSVDEWATRVRIIDNNKGYLIDNCIVVSALTNVVKNSATPDQILKVGNFYKKLYKEKGIKDETK